MQILEKNDLLTGNKTFGVIEEILNDTTLLVYMQQSGMSEMVNCSPRVEYKLGDFIIIEYINNNPHDRFVMGVIKGGHEIEPIDYAQLPTEPVELIRNANKVAYRFIYGYDNPLTQWEQELVRNAEGKVSEIIHRYPDGFTLIRNLIRDNDDLLKKYE